MNKNQFKKLPWNIELANAWKNLLPPVRPSVEELKIYNKYIKNVLKNNSKARILILGSTPEFRDLILKYKSTPICLDINSVVFKALKTLVKRKGKEIFICSDWLKLKDKNKFDLIIGHEVFNMIPINKYSFLTQAIAENLKTDGLYIHTMILRASHSQKVLPLTCFKRYRRLPERIKKGVPLFTVVQGNLEVCCY
ncbi:hypothetical protein KKG58_02865, partial [Patescibacteria group bacterium]|nr:hypothetical protein [Patescibacteria group bacterium]